MSATDDELMDCFDAIAEEFYRETGMVAPGKDDPTGRHTFAERWAAFVPWMDRRAARESEKTV